MKSRVFVTAAILFVLLITGLVVPAHTALATGTSAGTRQLSSSGTGVFVATQEGADGLQQPEFGPSLDDGPGASPASAHGQRSVNRSLTHALAQRIARVTSAKKPGDGDGGSLLASFNGLNFRQQRLANGGNQFSVEPPDQGLCVGNGFVLESVNDVLRVYDTTGNPLMGVVDLNTFYGYPPAIVRATGARGPFVTDPSCYYDPDTQRWFQLVLTLDVNPTTGAFLGSNHLDLAVSQTSSPLGQWTIYRIAAQDDGTQGTFNHNCAGGPCLGDYPHLGADANGFYITTNEYPFFADGFHAAQIYVLPKHALAAGAPFFSYVQYDTLNAVNGNPGFTIWPATSPAGQYETKQGGTEYFLSSMAAEEANGTGTDNRIALWGLQNTQAINSDLGVSLDLVILNVRPYSVPPKADQKAGSFPLGQCLNDTACSTFLLGAPDPFAPETESVLDSNDTRMQQVVFANGRVYGALDTAVSVDDHRKTGNNNQQKAGIEWFAIKPQSTGAGIKGQVRGQGYLGVENNNLTYPAIAVLPNGRGVMAFTLTGRDFYPSAAYAVFHDDDDMENAIHLAAAGLGPQDGFSGYKAFGNPPGTTRPRWGDYGAAVADGNSIWIASEYIAQTCTLAQYETTPFGSCGGTRATLGNWGTRISNVKP